jgi:glycerophosphoryl diester phosphodiesterase
MHALGLLRPVLAVALVVSAADAAPLVIAHRGDSAHAPENTLAAFDGAVAKRADWVELDAHLSRDGEAIVLHDRTVDRTTDGHGRVADLTVAQIKALDAGAWFAPQFAGERIPTLSEALARLKGRLPVLIELKEVGNDHGQERAVRAQQLVRRCLAVVEQHAMAREVRFHTFYPANLLALRKLARGIPYAFLYDEPDRRVASVLFAKGLSAAGYHPSLENTSRRIVRFAHGMRMSVWSYTANSESDFRKGLALGVDGIITDRPAELRAFLHGTGGAL